MAQGSDPRTSRLLPSLPFGIMAVVAAVDLVTGPAIGLLPLVSLGPAFAGLTGGWRRTAAIGVAAVVLCLGLSVFDGLFGTRRGFTALLSVAGVTVAGLAAAVMRQRREAELASVRSIAEVAQRVLLRPVPRSAGRLRVAVSYTSAVAEARIGGDLYEVVTSPGGVRVIVGDVQGEGAGGGGDRGRGCRRLREAAYDAPDVKAVGERLEQALERRLTREKFVTAVLAQVGDGSNITLINFGHPAPLAIRASGGVAYLEPPGRALPLGPAAQGIPGPEPYWVPFAPGDQVLFYTDGVTRPVTARVFSTLWTSGWNCSRTPTRNRRWRPCGRT